MAIDPARVKALFRAAIERADPGERRAFLDREVGEDAELLGRLEALLAAHDRPLDTSAPFPTPPPGETRDAVPTSSHRGPEPSTIVDAVIAGRYKVRQEIGEGGMGIVYLAEQSRPIRRQVALKLIRAGMDSRTVLARFESERQALALMDHPNIAKVLDAGTSEAGRPFFVMELVKGVPLTDYCDAHRLDLPERLALFRQICSAVQHAHQKGVIHRDLKPTNILVESHDGKPVPKVIDFGLAKATSGMPLTEQSLFTAFGSVQGTPLYMAPEQATFNALDVDTRADIYSLGVILYELLTGSTPIRRDTIKRAALDEMLRVIREEEPPTPSSRISTSESLPSLAANRHVEPARLSRFVRGDLDWIVMKALAKDRTRRYDSAIDLASDIERFTNHEPVSAGPPTAAYRLRKFARRNRARVGAAALVLLALVVGIVGTTAGMVRARNAERAILGESRRANDERDRAVRAESAARARSEEAIAEKGRADEKADLAEAVSEFLRQDILGATSFTVPLSGKGGADITVPEAVDLAASRVGERFAGRPLVEAMVRSTLGNTYLELGRFDRAAEQQGEAVRLFRLVKGERDDPESVRATLTFAWIRLCQGRMAESRGLHADALRRAEKSLPPESPIRLTAMMHFAHCLSQLGEFEAANPLFERAIEAQRRSTGESLGLQMSRNNQALSYFQQGRFAEAEPIYTKGLAEHRRLAGDLHPNTLLLMRNLAQTYCAMGRWDAAEPRAREALDGVRKAFGAGRVAAAEVESLGYLSRTSEARGRPADHRAVVADLLAMLEASKGALPAQSILVVASIAERARGLGDREQATRLDRLAERLGEEALAEKGSKSGPDEPETLSLMNTLAASYWRSGRLDRSIPLFEEALKLRVATSGPDHLDTWLVRANLGVNYKDAGRPDESLPLLEGAYRASRDRPSLRWVGSPLLDAYARAGRSDKVPPLAAELLAEGRGRLPAGSPQLAGLLAQVGASLVDVGAWDDAEPPLRECLDIRAKSDPNAWTTSNTRSLLGATLLGRKNYAEAEPLLRAGYEGMKQRESSIPLPARSRLANAIDRLIALGEATGKTDEVAAWKAERATLPAPVPKPAAGGR